MTITDEKPQRESKGSKVFRHALGDTIMGWDVGAEIVIHFEDDQLGELGGTITNADADKDTIRIAMDPVTLEVSRDWLREH
jgi:hypothetical protein